MLAISCHELGYTMVNKTWKIGNLHDLLFFLLSLNFSRKKKKRFLIRLVWNKSSKKSGFSPRKIAKSWAIIKVSIGGQSPQDYQEFNSYIKECTIHLGKNQSSTIFNPKNNPVKNTDLENTRIMQGWIFFRYS